MSSKGKEKMSATATDRIEGTSASKDGVLKQSIPRRMQPNAVQRTASFTSLPKPPPSPSISANRTNGNTVQPSLPNNSHISLARQTLSGTPSPRELNGYSVTNPGARSGASVAPRDPAHEELELLHDNISDVRGRSNDHELRTAPIITRDAYVAAGYREGATQYGVLGSILSIHNKNNVPYRPVNPQLYVNTNAPFSAVVCGVQGSGKSHTVSLLLESMFIPNMRSTGTLQKPLSGIVLHFGEGGPSSRPSEAAWISSSHFPGVGYQWMQSDSHEHLVLRMMA